MKKLLIIVSVLFFSNAINAQTLTYKTEMEIGIKMLDTIKTKIGYENSINHFKKIALANEKEWLPPYYIAYCNLVLGIKGDQDEETKDNIYNTAFDYLDKADLINPNNSEVYALKGYITFMQLAVSPQQRAMKMIPTANELIAKAIALDSENPRAYLLKGQNSFYTPEMFGGGKDDAKQTLLIAKSKFAKFIPENLAPNWGKDRCEELLKEYQQ